MLAINGMNNDADEAVDRALMNVYLNRPDLVEATETQLQESGSLREDIDMPIAQTVELAEQVAPMPDEPEVVPAAEVEVTKPKFWTKKGDGFLLPRFPIFRASLTASAGVPRSRAPAS